MKRLLRAVNRVFGKRGKLGDVWRWAKKGKPTRRWHAAFLWARRKERWNRAHRRFDRAKWWAQVKTIYRHKWKRAVRHHQQTGQVQFQSWMLNGHSGNIDEDLKPVIAWLVVVGHQAVTDTYDFCCHAAGSYHYPRNNSDGQGHAVDTAGPDMCTTMVAELNKFGQAHWLELFGPCNWYIKNGSRFSGMFPGHSTHIHSAVA